LLACGLGLTVISTSELITQVESISSCFNEQSDVCISQSKLLGIGAVLFCLGSFFFWAVKETATDVAKLRKQKLEKRIKK
jgi:hypothetical protein